MVGDCRMDRGPPSPLQPPEGHRMGPQTPDWLQRLDKAGVLPLLGGKRGAHSPGLRVVGALIWMWRKC